MLRFGIVGNDVVKADYIAVGRNPAKAGVVGSAVETQIH